MRSSSKLAWAARVGFDEVGHRSDGVHAGTFEHALVDAAGGGGSLSLDQSYQAAADLLQAFCGQQIHSEFGDGQTIFQDGAVGLNNRRGVGVHRDDGATIVEHGLAAGRVDQASFGIHQQPAIPGVFRQAGLAFDAEPAVAFQGNVEGVFGAFHGSGAHINPVGGCEQTTTEPSQEGVGAKIWGIGGRAGGRPLHGQGKIRLKARGLRVGQIVGEGVQPVQCGEGARSRD